MTFTVREQEWRMGLHSRRQDHRVARQRAAAARDSYLLLCGAPKWSMQRDAENERREANRLYAMVYLQVRQQLKQERSTRK